MVEPDGTGGGGSCGCGVRPLVRMTATERQNAGERVQKCGWWDGVPPRRRLCVSFTALLLRNRLRAFVSACCADEANERTRGKRAEHCGRAHAASHFVREPRQRRVRGHSRTPTHEREHERVERCGDEECIRERERKYLTAGEGLEGWRTSSSRHRE